MTIDTDWEFKANHWEREARRLIIENNNLKNKILLTEQNDHSLIDKYRDPKTGTFSFPGDVAKVIRHYEGVLAPFRSGGDWGYIKALIVAGAPDPAIGRNLAKKITDAQAAIDRGLMGGPDGQRHPRHSLPATGS